MSSRRVANQGASAAFIVILVIAAVAAGYLAVSTSRMPNSESTTALSSSTTSTSSAGKASTTSTMSAVNLVNGSFANHMRLLASRNTSAMVSQYGGNSSIVWTGEALGLAGIYNGTSNIGLLFNASFFGPRSTALAVGNVTQTILAASDDSAVVNSSFTFLGSSSLEGNFSGSVSAMDYYVFSAASGSWLISQETWNFLSYNVQFPFAYIGCTGPSCPQSVQDMAFSEDDNYMAAGMYGSSGFGAVYLVSMQGRTPSVVWKSVTTNTVIWSVAISANGSYVAAAGFSHPGDKHGNGRVYLFDKEGKLLWNVSAGSEPRMVWVAISADGSRVAADYGSGIIYLDATGDVLWNHTFPQGGFSYSFATSSDARFIAYADDNITLPGGAGQGWGVFYLDSQGNLLWNHTEDRAGGDSFVQMSSDGSYVAASSQRFYNGSLYFFDGRNGSLLWSYPVFTSTGIANYNSLVMSQDGAYVAFGGPSTGVSVFESSGKTLWQGPVSGFGEPVLMLENASLVLLYQPSGNDFQLVEFNGTAVASSNINDVSAFAGSPNGPVWVASGGEISTTGGCAVLDFYDGSTALSSTQLCQ
jgi:putative pyrroloquinoline-quinone binding quinoprotein